MSAFAFEMRPQSDNHGCPCNQGWWLLRWGNKSSKNLWDSWAVSQLIMWSSKQTEKTLKIPATMWEVPIGSIFSLGNKKKSSVSAHASLTSRLSREHRASQLLPGTWASVRCLPYYFSDYQCSSLIFWKCPKWSLWKYDKLKNKSKFQNKWKYGHQNLKQKILGI